jgi:hypothetical protein
MEPSDADVAEAVAVLSRYGAKVDETDIQIVATGLTVRRQASDGHVGIDALRAAHDLLCMTTAQHRVPDLLSDLATLLLARGYVPAPDAHEGRWWLWWPKKGRGPCRDCGQERSLTRYSNTFGGVYRYLCGRCRKQELADQTADLDRVTGVTREPGEDASSLMFRRMTAIFEQYRLASESIDDDAEPSVKDLHTKPTDDDWDRHVATLEELLTPLAWAGWLLPDEYDCDFDPELGPWLYGEIRRTSMVVNLEYGPSGGKLDLQPFDDVAGEEPDAYTTLDDTLAIVLTGDVEADRKAVADRVGEAGLLDATRVRADGNSTEMTRLMYLTYGQWILAPAVAHSGATSEELAAKLDADRFFSTFFTAVVGFVGRDVLPDLIPDAAALGIAAWCWRNNTAVEAWHLPDDVLMARVNIAVTKAIQPHIDSVEGVDWDSVQQALTDPTWRLADGRVIADLFGEGWADVCATVSEQVHEWKRLDETILGPEATIRLLTIGGSTSYTRHWWGQGRWNAICQRIIDDAAAAGIALPVPYDSRGALALAADLADPEQVSDIVLDWLIDMPGPGTDGPRGLRMHTEVTRPVYRTMVDIE